MWLVVLASLASATEVSTVYARSVMRLVVLASLASATTEVTVYADNFFELNGEFVTRDTRLLPHTAFRTTMELQKGENVISAYLRDNAGELGLEYGDRCIGDGGFRLKYGDIVTNDDWKCRTSFYGPVNPEQCFGLGIDFTGQRAAFGAGTENTLARPTNPIPACRDDRPAPVTDAQRGFFYPETCRTILLDWFVEETDLDEDGLVALRDDGYAVNAAWAMPGYDDSSWHPAVEYSELQVGYGVFPGTETGPVWETTEPFFGEVWGRGYVLPDELVEFPTQKKEEVLLHYHHLDHHHRHYDSCRRRTGMWKKSHQDLSVDIFSPSQYTTTTTTIPCVVSLELERRRRFDVLIFWAANERSPIENEDVERHQVKNPTNQLSLTWRGNE